jgi:hypothetical protein
MTKGVAKFDTNLKPYKPLAGETNPVVTLPKNGWIFGDKGLTDITGFTHYYKPDGSRIELAAQYKATIGNLITTEEAEPADPIDPPSAGTGEIINIRTSLDGGKTYDAGRYYERLADA